MSLSELHLRPFENKDREQLDYYRKAFSPDGRIDVPFGYAAPGIETAVAMRGDRMVGAAIATSAVVIDFMKDPNASSVETYAAVVILERTLAYQAQRSNIAAGYVAIPSHMKGWLSIVQRSGYTPTFQDCVVLRRSFRDEVKSHTDIKVRL